MWKKIKKDNSIDENSNIYTSVIDGLKKIYKNKIKPLEELYNFPYFHSPTLNDSDFEAKPMVLLLGQYSTGIKFFLKYIYYLKNKILGKTSFIQYLLERDFPGANIGIYIYLLKIIY